MGQHCLLLCFDDAVHDLAARRVYLLVVVFEVPLVAEPLKVVVGDPLAVFVVEPEGMWIGESLTCRGPLPQDLPASLDLPPYRVVVVVDFDPVLQVDLVARSDLHVALLRMEVALIELVEAQLNGDARYIVIARPVLILNSLVRWRSWWHLSVQVRQVVVPGALPLSALPVVRLLREDHRGVGLSFVHPVDVEVLYGLEEGSDVVRLVLEHHG